MLKKLALFPVLVGFACVLAGIYGMVHNQISYSVSPDYFRAFKFAQFRIAPALPDRIGAAIVGWNASWWMGIVIGIPVGLLGLFIPDLSWFIRSFLKVSLVIVLITLASGLVVLAIGYIVISAETLPTWMAGRNVPDPVAFARAGNMHNFSYLGGFIGAVVGCGLMVRSAIKNRR